MRLESALTASFAMLSTYISIAVTAAISNDSSCLSSATTSYFHEALSRYRDTERGRGTNVLHFRYAAIASASRRRVIGTTDVLNFDDDGFPFVRFHRKPFGGFREFQP
jgi:hypothetical protein